MAEAEPSSEAKPLPRLGSYLLTRQLGSGGMSNVFRAVHEGSGSVVAVKVLPRALAKNVTLLQRFIREAKSAEALDHPNIVAIYDRGHDQGRHYLVLEFVEGRDLHDRVRLNGPLGPEEAIKLVREVAEGLRYAAGRGMIHRDVKPANLLIDSAGKAKIIDLGLALQTDDEDERVTRDGTTVGTVDYMAPEQARDSRKTSERSDIYSLGCTLYYLLTGSAPYPGGGLAEKLARHYNAPIPDVRDRRPEVPAGLALLVQRMMAKKPEGRFEDYTHLIAALDALSATPSPANQAVPLDALFADDDEDDFIQLEPAGPTLPGKSGPVPARPASTAPFLTAEIVDDDDDEEGPPTTWPTTRPAEPASAPSGQVVSLGELASLDGEDEDAPRAAKRPPSQVRPAAATSPTFDDLIDSDPEPVGVRVAGRRAGGDELSLKTWIAAGVMVGLGVALVGLGISLLLAFTKGEPELASRDPDRPANADPDTSSLNGPVAPAARPPVARPTPPPKKTPKAAPKIEVAAVVAPVVGPEVLAEEKRYPVELEGRLTPSGPKPEAIRTARIEVVRRVPGAGQDPSVALLAAAFGKVAEVVEIADVGPFFEDDFQLPGKTRVIRGRAGLRPILKVELSTQQTVKEQEAKFLLGGPRLEQLVLEGLDLVVDVRDLPLQQASLFLCQGADVTLRDCTLTIYNGGDRKLSIFRLVEGPRPNRVVLERTTIRGPIRTLVEVASARAEVVIDRSLVVGDAGPLISLEPAEKPARSLYLIRSVLTTRGPLIDWSFGKPGPVSVKALGSTLARVDGPGVAPLMHCRSAFAGPAADLVGWSGADNTLAGWPAALTSGPESSILAARLAGIRSDPPAPGEGDRELVESWPDSANREEVVPADFFALAPGLRPTLARAARPHALLRELTVDLMRRLPTPDLAANPAAPPPVTNRVGAKPVPVVDASFDPDAAPWFGDLGKFLAATVKDPVARHVVRIKAGSNVVHAMSPVRLPDGSSVAILGNAPEGSKQPLPSFAPTPEAAGRPLIEVRGGDLALVDFGFASDGVTRPLNWIRSEDGILGLRHCRFRDPGGPDPAVGPMIAFVARGTAPIAPRFGPLAQATDRPSAVLRNCLLWTGADAILADVGRGVVDLENCLVIAGPAAFTLQPGNAAADRFEADLVLQRCTVADDKSGILLKPWPGPMTRSPDRPWLVTTKSCVFPKTQRDPAGGLLAVDPDTFARGVLFWQSFGDAYEVGRFLASTGPQPQGGQPGADLKKQWIDLWGGEHTRSDRGPDPRHNDRVLRYKDKDHPRPGRSFPLALELDPKTPAFKDLGVNFKEIPPPPAR